MLEVLRVSIENQEIRAKTLPDQLPEDWSTASSLMGHTGVALRTITKFVEQYRDTKPEWFGKFKIHKKVAEGYHPDLISLITEKLFIPELPNNWETANRLSEKIGLDVSTIRNFAESYRIASPSWFGQYRSHNQTAEGYHPDLLKEIYKNLALPKMPINWQTANKLNEKIGSAAVTITKFADQYRVFHPEWFGKFQAGPNKVEGFHPDLVKLIEDKFIVEVMPSGWLSASMFMNEYGPSRTTVINFANKFKNLHPEWFKEYKTGKKAVECYHPDLIIVLKDNLVFHDIKIGWKTINMLREEFGISPSVTAKIINQYRTSHPWWFDKFKSGVNTVEGFHPELVELIRQKQNK